MATQPQPGRYTLDPAASSVTFKHKTFWGLATVKGSFATVRGTGEVGADGSGNGTLAIEAATLDTKNAKRDTHLRSKEFFEADQYPEVLFEATQIKPTDAEGGASVEGELTVRGQSRRLSFPARYEASGAGVVLRGTVQIDRGDFGMTWNQLGMMGGQTTVDLELRFTAAS